VETFTEDMFEFWEARIVGGDEGAGVGVMGGLKGLDVMREEGSGNLLGNEGRGITSGEEGLGEVNGVGDPGDCGCSAPGWTQSRKWSLWRMRYLISPAATPHPPNLHSLLSDRPGAAHLQSPG
jgi:hypothetical protein